VVSMSQWCLCHSGVYVTVVSMSQWCLCHSGVYVTVVSMSQWWSLSSYDSRDCYAGDNGLKYCPIYKL